MNAINNKNCLNTRRIIEDISSIRKRVAAYFFRNFNKGYKYCIAKKFASFYSIGASLAIKQLKGGWSDDEKLVRKKSQEDFYLFPLYLAPGRDLGHRKDAGLEIRYL